MPKQKGFFGQTPRGSTCYDKVYGDVPFSWVYFLPEKSGAEYQFLKNLKQGNTLLENRPTFFIEHMTESENQKYYFKSGKVYIFMYKITENLRRHQILEKWRHRVSFSTKNSKAGCPFLPNFLKQVVTEIPKKCNTPAIYFKKYPLPGADFGKHTFWRRIMFF